MPIRALPILSKRRGIRIQAWQQLQKHYYAASDSLEEAREKDSSLAAALKTVFFKQMLSKSAIYA